MNADFIVSYLLLENIYVAFTFYGNVYLCLLVFVFSWNGSR